MAEASKLQKELYLEERQQAILTQIQQQGRGAVVELSRQFGVSEVTIRADLQALADQNLVVRTHGGAIPSSRLPDFSLNVRKQQQVAEKNRIGAAGAKCVLDGEAIFLDASSTALAVAQHLKRHRDLTVVTNSLAAAQLMFDAPGVSVVMPAGTLQRDTVSLVGTLGLEFLQKFNIQKGFFGAHGLSQPEGLTDASAADAEVKHQIVKMCREVYAVLDSTKWGRVGVASFARLEDVHCIITNDSIPAPLAALVQKSGIKIILA